MCTSICNCSTKQSRIENLINMKFLPKVKEGMRQIIAFKKAAPYQHRIPEHTVSALHVLYDCHRLQATGNILHVNCIGLKIQMCASAATKSSADDPPHKKRIFYTDPDCRMRAPCHKDRENSATSLGLPGPYLHCFMCRRLRIYRLLKNLESLQMFIKIVLSPKWSLTLFNTLSPKLE